MNTRKLTVLQIIPQLESGGAEQGVIDIAQALQAQGHTALAVSAGGKKVAQLTACGATHLTLPAASKNPYRLWKNACALQKIIKSHKVDVVHARSRAPAWSAWWACRKTRTPFMTTFHGTYNAQNWLKRFYNSIMVRGDAVIAISDAIRAHIETFYQGYKASPQILTRIYRGIDLEVFDPEAITKARQDVLRRAWGLPEACPLLLMPARLTRWKGQMTVLKALQKIQDKRFFCVFVGSDQGRTHYRSELMDFIKAHALETQVKIVPECTDMPAAYSLADVVIHASTDAEAFGRVVSEAQAMKKPVIATNHGGPTEIIEDQKTGWLTPPGDVDVLGETLKTALSLTPEQKTLMGESARTRTATHFTKAQMCDKTLRVYQSLSREKILVIKHGALGDFFSALGAMASIREHHQDTNSQGGAQRAHITLLTSSAYVSLAQEAPYFDAIWVDDRPKLWCFHRWMQLRKRFRRARFDRVYDLQNSKRTAHYYRFFGPRQPDWSGVAPGCSHPQTHPNRPFLQTFERFEDQLKVAGISKVSLPSVEWMRPDVSRFGLPASYALLVPGSSAKGTQKRWPARHYATLSCTLQNAGITPVLVGGKEDQDAIAEILSACPTAVDLSTKTHLFEIVALARGARFILGNDTGPIHMAAATRRPTFILWSGFSDPRIYAPTYPTVRVLHKEDLADLSIDEVETALVDILQDQKALPNKSTVFKK